MITTIDYETEAIEGNPLVNPPRPVGVAIKYGKDDSKYLSWGHPTGNNCTEAHAVQELKKVWASSNELLCHNSPFDLSIAQKYHGFKLRSPLRYLDSQYSIFLTNPYAASFALKESAERVLHQAPTERDELKDWVLQNVRCNPTEWGAHISKAPGTLVAPYACGDVDRTMALHEYLHPTIIENGMLEAYRREQNLMPICVESSKNGIRVDRAKLSGDAEIYDVLLRKVDRWFFKRLGTEFDMDADAELANALEHAGVVHPSRWIRTPTGKRSTARKNLIQCIDDRDVLLKLNYRGALATLLNTFIHPWLLHSDADGRLHTQWNQVRGDKSNATSGARTGRMSSMQPNFQNVPNELPHKPDKWPELPHMRDYLLPEEGHVWLKRDFSAQEMRIAAHFADGKLAAAFREDPRTDPHDYVRGVITELTGLQLPRKSVKITGFQILYGGGANAVAGQLDIPYDEAVALRKTYFGAMPELETLSNDVRNRGRRGGFIRTWGGRVYYTEPAREINGRQVDFSYKLLNYLIQGSAADQTKQSVIDWHSEKHPETRLLAMVHDEINISAPVEIADAEMAKLKEAMNKDRFDVPFLSDGFIGATWHSLEDHV